MQTIAPEEKQEVFVLIAVKNIVLIV